MIQPDWRPEAKQLRQFAVISFFGFSLFGFLVWRSTGSVAGAAALVAIGAQICAAGLLRPESIRPIYLVLMAATLPIGIVFSGVLLRVVFYGVVTPIAFVFRLMGRDALDLRRPEGDSYWRDHPPADDAAGYFRQS